jgi:hypothetical protein
VLRRDLAGAVLKLPRRVGEDGAEPLPARVNQEVIARGEHNEILFLLFVEIATANFARCEGAEVVTVG